MVQDRQDDTLTLTGEAGSKHQQPRTGQRPVTAALADARDEVAAEAQALGDKAGEKAAVEADAVKDEAVRALEAFSGSLRSARDEFHGERLGFVGDMLGVAASRLSDAARSMDDVTSNEMIEAVRRYARRNPTGFLAMSAFAGFALGRVATATGGRTQPASVPIRTQTGPAMPRQTPGLTPGLPGTGYTPGGHLP